MPEHCIDLFGPAEITVGGAFFWSPAAVGIHVSWYCNSGGAEGPTICIEMQSPILTPFAARLYDLRHTGEIVPFREVGIGDGSAPDDWKPAPHYCHANVDTWVWRCPEYKAVRGWMVFDNPYDPLFQFSFPPIRSSAHPMASYGTLRHQPRHSPIRSFAIQMAMMTSTI